MQWHVQRKGKRWGTTGQTSHLNLDKVWDLKTHKKWMEHDWQITSVTASAQHKMPAIRGSHRLFEWSGGHAIAINWSPCLCMRTWTDNEFSLARLAKILTWRFQRWVVSLESNQKDLQPWRRLQKQFGGGTKTNRILTDSRVTTCKPSPHWQQKDAKLQSRRLHPCLLISLLLLQCLLDVIPEKKRLWNPGSAKHLRL